MIKRIFDILLSGFALLGFLIPCLIVAICIKYTSKGPILFWSKRVGRYNQIFLMPKFRSMRIDTPQVATHLIQNPAEFITPFGRFLRSSSIDEIPQLLSILKGDMSIVGPRPALFNQDDLIGLRTDDGIDKLRPGLTGWAQVNGRDELSIVDKVELDKYYLLNESFALDVKIIMRTAKRVFKSSDISH